MNNFFYRLKIFFERLHVIAALILIIFWLIGQFGPSNIRLSMISQGFEIESGLNFLMLVVVIIASGVFWSFMISSFVDTNQVILDRLTIKEKIEKKRFENKNREGASSQITSREFSIKYFQGWCYLSCSNPADTDSLWKLWSF